MRLITEAAKINCQRNSYSSEFYTSSSKIYHFNHVNKRVFLRYMFGRYSANTTRWPLCITLDYCKSCHVITGLKGIIHDLPSPEVVFLFHSFEFKTEGRPIYHQQ